MQAPIPVVVAIDERTESGMDMAKVAAEGGFGVTVGRERGCGPEIGPRKPFRGARCSGLPLNGWWATR